MMATWSSFLVRHFRSEASARPRHCVGQSTMLKIHASHGQLFDYLWVLLYTVAPLSFSIAASYYLKHHFTPQL